MLLDPECNAKVADFGTVREGVEQGGADSARLTHASTKLVVGTVTTTSDDTTWTFA